MATQTAEEQNRTITTELNGWNVEEMVEAIEEVKQHCVRHSRLIGKVQWASFYVTVQINNLSPKRFNL